jgi:Ca2+-binding EF-hand superfamily protein
MASTVTSPGANPGSEFTEFSRKQMMHYQKMFKHYDADRDKFLNSDDLQKMLKKMNAKSIQQMQRQPAEIVYDMIKEVDEDNDGKLSLREFVLIFHKALKGQLHHVALIEIFLHLHVVDADHEDEIPAITAFKAKIDEWSATEEGTMI